MRKVGQGYLNKRNFPSNSPAHFRRNFTSPGQKKGSQ
jgi:hypothetical protein